MKAFRNKKSAGFTLVEIMIVVLIIGILLAIAIPNFVKARETSRAKACVANLKQVDSAKQQYMMDKNISTYTGAMTDLAPTYIRVAPTCPAGGTYTVGDQTTSPTCSLATTTPASYASTGLYPHYIP
jgi:prepilin-type N-terminal cleavage/methylation domain-containing protein